MLPTVQRLYCKVRLGHIYPVSYTLDIWWAMPTLHLLIFISSDLRVSRRGTEAQRGGEGFYVIQVGYYRSVSRFASRFNPFISFKSSSISPSIRFSLVLLERLGFQIGVMQFGKKRLRMRNSI